MDEVFDPATESGKIIKHLKRQVEALQQENEELKLIQKLDMSQKVRLRREIEALRISLEENGE